MEPQGHPRQVLADAARLFYERGWMMGTAGNLSLRLADGTFWITASSQQKGRLQQADFLRVAPGGEVVFTMHWSTADRWEGTDYRLTIV